MVVRVEEGAKKKKKKKERAVVKWPAEINTGPIDKGGTPLIILRDTPLNGNLGFKKFMNNFESHIWNLYRKDM